MNKVLVLSVHPDDETLGCGGTLIKHRNAGDEIHWLILTKAHSPQWKRTAIQAKAQEIKNVSRAYGMKSVKQFAFPAALLDTVPQAEIMHALAPVVESIRPETVYLVHRGDVNSDHRAAFYAVMSVLKPFHMLRLGIRRILSYETLSSTEAAAPYFDQAFLPTVFSDISDQLEDKLRIMEFYDSEIHHNRGPRCLAAIRALAYFRGASLTTKAAEAFMLVREISK